MAKFDVVIEMGEEIWDQKVFLNGEEISMFVSQVKFSVAAGEQAVVSLELLPTTVKISGKMQVQEMAKLTAVHDLLGSKKE